MRDHNSVLQPSAPVHLNIVNCIYIQFQGSITFDNN